MQYQYAIDQNDWPWFRALSFVFWQMCRKIIKGAIYNFTGFELFKLSAHIVEIHCVRMVKIGAALSRRSIAEAKEVIILRQNY